MPKILIVDDKASDLKLTQKVLLDVTDNITLCQEPRNVMGLCKQSTPDLIFLDLEMPHLNGEDLLEEILSSWPNLPIIVLTGDENEVIAERCLKKGAFDFLNKPISALRIKSSARKALQFKDDQSRLERIQEEFLFSDQCSNVFDHILTQDANMKRLFQYSEVLASTDRDILITGETGTGKDLFANAIHNLSQREGEFVAVNVAGLDDNHFSDTLFGHTKGSFTVATSKRDGLIEKARRGTLFLDEIGDLSINSQVKLLRLLQEREYLPIGADEHVSTDTRIIVATSRPLVDLMESGEFRKDLYYRLRAQKVEIPPLRERSADIPMLWSHFSKKCAQQLNCKEPVISDKALDALQTYEFLGNVRELEALVFQAISLFKHYIDEAEISQVLGKIEPIDYHKPLVSDKLVFPEPLPFVDDVIDQLIVTALERCKGNQSQAAKAIGMSRRGLISRMRRHHINY